MLAPRLALRPLVEWPAEPHHQEPSPPPKSKNEYKGCFGCKVLGQNLADAKCSDMQAVLPTMAIFSKIEDSIRTECSVLVPSGE